MRLWFWLALKNQRVNPLRKKYYVYALVFWPIPILLLEILILIWAESRGCTIWARGPEPCIVLGRDIGEHLYPLWSVGYQAMFGIGWVIDALLIWGLVKLVFWVRRRWG